jgi:hypothetical protein
MDFEADSCTAKTFDDVWEGGGSHEGSHNHSEIWRRIRFRMTPAIDAVKMAELVALVDPSAAPQPAMEFPRR